MLRSIPDAVKFDLSEGEDDMKFKDLIFHSHRKIRSVLKKTASLELQDSTLDEEAGIFLENQETSHPCSPTSFFFSLNAACFKYRLKVFFHVCNCSSYKDRKHRAKQTKQHLLIFTLSENCFLLCRKHQHPACFSPPGKFLQKRRHVPTPITPTVGFKAWWQCSTGGK